MIRRVFPLGLGIAVLAATATAGERAQTSGARKKENEEKKPVPAETEAERVSLLNRVLRDRRFDIFKSSIGGAIDAPIPTPSTAVPMLDPKTQKRLLEEVDRKKNWLVEPGSTTPRELEKVADPNAIPDFSRDRNRYPTATDGDGRAEFSTRSGRKLPGVREDGSGDNRPGLDKHTEGGRADMRETLSEASRTGSDSHEDPVSDWGAGGARRRQELSFGARSGVTERLAGTFDFGGGRDSDFGSGFGADIKSFGAAGGAREFLNPFSDPAKAQSLDNDPFVDPGQKLDPTALPQSSFGIRDDAFTKVETFAPAATAAPGAPGFGAFGGEAAGVGAGIKSLITTPAPEPVRVQQPTFVPRPAVLNSFAPATF